MQPTSTSATQKDNSSEKKDNYMVSSGVWDPVCVIA
ncbi:hypothetical protein KAFR_0K02130 [Kazachstania africana CBS 2517]|uniref:Uncharacterized protein n=1 Tax=Kazachstania africana (strain ATCC 22294 / BCRC 22015 / CBS 2517 / CECT 1963 / NBRC 1671 / NRRL Y-8276) TaxID=1071382 RepID=H2AWA5_KAZAF|nr:hypothetical protein KAFR_0F00580 [Kazachstania africana CBS 2517]XP_003959702.1 hypothetical protein KAFR_0K02130 [Kazachstania africana CBS 2517]CCF58655.1 hypothetical protein KAFR_0F00580 [Kazachstania africana CBS 2517]CCF60567.1 hypothetical protein KAFR_0K02130 [Kazachstania africana CBS 2517]